MGKKSTNDTLTRKKKLSDTGQRSLLSEYHDYLEANPDPGCCGRDSLLCFLLCGGFGFGGKRPHPSTEIERRRREMMDKLSRLSLGILLVSLLLLLSSTVVSYLGFLLASYYLTHHLGFVSVYYVAVPYCLAAIGILTIRKNIFSAPGHSLRSFIYVLFLNQDFFLTSLLMLSIYCSVFHAAAALVLVVVAIAAAAAATVVANYSAACKSFNFATTSCFVVQCAACTAAAPF